jgi:molybdopterin synthase catalytic subunit
MRVLILFTHAPIVKPEVTLESREIGAVVEFWGIVREQEGEQYLAGLAYEAYLPMAHTQMQRIFEELSRDHPCDAVEFIHRLGPVPVNEPSLWIRVQSRHRAEALCLLSESVRRMKIDVPIWKASLPS